jgi:3-hydroxyisobutyrate dehydrogenase
MKIAFFGTGLMGKPMALQLIKAGHNVTVYNRSPEKTKIFHKMGTLVANSPGEAAEAADLLITMLTDYQAIVDTLIDEELAIDKKHIIQMGTLSSHQSLKLKQIFEERNASYVEAPVLGSIPQAQSGTLIVLFGGSKTQYRKWHQLLSHFGNNIQYVGHVGQAMSTKLALNQLIVSLTTAFSMSLGFLENRKISIKIFMDILRNSSLYAQTFDKKLTRMQNRNFENPNFPLKHLLKDLHLIIDEFRDCQIETGPLDKMAEILSRTSQAGFSEQDYSVLYNTINPAHSTTAGNHK